MKPNVIQTIEDQTGKPLKKLSGLKQLVDGVRHQHNHSCVFENGKLVLLNVSRTNSLDEVLFNPWECRGLKYLNLSENKNLAKVTWEGPLVQLKHLDLSECNLNEITLPTGCGLLEQAWLHKSGIKTFFFDGSCPKLELLDLGGNQLKTLTLPAGFDSLAHLYLAENGLEELTFEPGKETEGKPIRFKSPLPYLSTLHLGANRLIEVPENIIFSEKLTALYLGGNAPKNIPKVFLGDYDSLGADNCLADARIWFDQLKDHPGRKNRVVKLMLTGNGNVGKSTLACSMRHGSCDHDHDTTHGILIDALNLDSITYNIWDFGGQEVYHGTHRLFMGSEAMQAIVFDVETEEHARNFITEKDRIRQETILPHPLEYWYETTQKISPHSLFFFIQNNKRPGEPDDQTANSYDRNRGKFIPLNAKTGEDVDDFLHYLKKRAPNLPDFNMTMPGSWLKVRQFFIDNLESRDSKKIITRKDYERLCKNCRVVEKARPLLFRYLHHNGFLYSHQNLGDSIIADQRWALQAIYKPYDRKKPHYDEFLDLEGKIRGQRLFEIFGCEYKEAEKWLFLDFMISCGLCFQLNNKPWQAGKKKSDIYVFPEFLPSVRPEDVTRFWQNYATDVHLMRYRLPWLNYYVIQSFITAIGRKTKTRNFWRYGIQVSTDEGCFKVELDYAQKALLLHIEKSATPKWLLAVLEELRQDHGQQGWEISADSVNFRPFNPVDWQALERHKSPEHKMEMRERKEEERLATKLPDVEQSAGRPVILFLAANPTPDELSIRNEHSHIHEKLKDKSKEKPSRQKFELVPKLDTSIDVMIDEINDHKPTIVHFCGHGKEVNPDTKKDGGLVFHKDDFQGEKVIDAERLGKIFKRIKAKNPELNVVFLNACYSEPQAIAISQAEIYAIGADDILQSTAARFFAAGFYREYAKTLDVKSAVNNAMTYGLGENPDIESLIHLFYKGKEITI